MNDKHPLHVSPCPHQPLPPSFWRNRMLTCLQKSVLTAVVTLLVGTVQVPRALADDAARGAREEEKSASIKVFAPGKGDVAGGGRRGFPGGPAGACTSRMARR